MLLLQNYNFQYAHLFLLVSAIMDKRVRAKKLVNIFWRDVYYLQFYSMLSLACVVALQSFHY